MSETPKPRRAIGYIRASTRDQQLSPHAQLEAIESWCERNDVELVSTVQDLGVSGAAELEKRPGLLEALDAVKSEKAEVFIVAKLDRIARDTLLSAMIQRLAERNGAEITSADGTGNGRSPESQLLRDMIAAFASYERQIIRHRTRAALAVKKARGERTGQVPFGYRVAEDGLHLEENPNEEVVIDEMISMREQGCTYGKIVESLNARGIPSRGSRWHFTSVRRILTRELQRRSQIEAA